jgi:bifunctional lysine-specific demethylase and histidyl-hydroxylase MINA
VTPKQAREIVQRILHPLPLDTFLDEVLGRRFIKLAGDDHANGRTGLLGADPESVILGAYEILAPKLTSHAAAPLGPPPRPERVADAAAFKAKIDAFHAGRHTVRLPEIHALTPEIHRFVRALEFLFHQPVQAAAFWSRDDGTAPIHHDNYDLIVIQLKGRKKWFISTDPSGLPNEWSVIPDGPPRLDRYEEVEVAPGDLLYLPRGTTHRVDAIAESIHLSLGFVPLTLRDAIIACIDHLSDLDRPLRDTLGAHIGTQVLKSEFDALPARIREGVEQLTRACANDGFVAGALQRRSSRAINKFDKLEKPAQIAVLAPSTRMRHSALAVCHLSGNQRVIDFAYPGGHHYINRGAEDAVTFIAHVPEFRIKDIPGAIGDDVRLALVQQLVASGFLEVAPD